MQCYITHVLVLVELTADPWEVWHTRSMGQAMYSKFSM